MSGAAEQKRRARHIEVAYHEGYLAGLREGRPSVEALADAERAVVDAAMEWYRGTPPDSIVGLALRGELPQYSRTARFGEALAALSASEAG